MTETLGVTSPTSTHDHAPTAGVRTASPAFVTAMVWKTLHLLSGTKRIRFSRSVSSACLTRRVTTEKASRKLTSTWTTHPPIPT